MAMPLRISDSIDGRQVNVALRDGTRIDDCQLIAIRRGGIDILWLFADGEDHFIACDNVLGLWLADDITHPTATHPSSRAHLPSQPTHWLQHTEQKGPTR